MASASTPDYKNNNGNIPKSYFQQTVCLADWWLVKAESDFQGRRLAVAGFTSREKQAMRVFSSAPILKRYDAFTLETADGVCVTIKGIMNKARTVENGFPSDVCNHFVFGFPPHWKECDVKFMGKESPRKNLSPQSKTVVGEKPHVNNREMDLGSQDKMDAKGMRKSKKFTSSARLPPKSDSIISGSGDNLNMSCIASAGLEKESCCGGPTVEDHISLDMPVNCLKNTMKSSTDSSFRKNFNVFSAVTDKDVDGSHIHDSGVSLSACHLFRSRSRKADDNLSNVKLDKKNSNKADFDRDKSLSEEILTCNLGSMITRSISSSKMKRQNNQTSVRISGCQKIRLGSVSSMGSDKVELASVDCKQAGGNNWNFEVSGLHGSMDKTKLSELDGPVKDEFEQISKTPNQDKDLRKLKTKGNMQKAKNKATRSLSTPAAADNREENVVADKNSLSEKAKASDMKTRRKLAYETPEIEKEKMPSASPQSLIFNRSRSGRLLMPTLEFWRNQRALYNADRTVTGIEEGIHLERPRKAVRFELLIGSGSTPQRKRRQLL